MTDYTPSPNNTIPLIALDRPIAYHRIFRTISGSTVAAVFLSQAWYWSQRLPPEREGWFYKTQAEWEEETGLSRSEQETARKHLLKIGVMEESRQGLPAKLWFRLDQWELARLINSAYKNAGIPQTGSGESHKQEGDIPAIIHTENTAETTAETISGGDDEIDWSSNMVQNGITFSIFWKVYPRKEAKADTMKAWQKLSPSPDLARTIIDAVYSQMENNWKDREKKYIPLPASWLRGKRWEDEIIVPQTNGPGHYRNGVQVKDKNGNVTSDGLRAMAEELRSKGL